ncbi:MAG: hypothetical protein ACFFBE_10400 [Promethearchaeota archaeon]
MVDWRPYTWVLPIIGAIFGLISLATPVIGSLTIYDISWGGAVSGNFEIWMLGYWESGSYNGWVNELSSELPIPINATITPFIICFIGLLICAVLGIRAGILGYQGTYKKSMAALSGILMIGLTILFIIWVEIEWSPFSGDTWEEEWFDVYKYQFDPDFGVIGPFIGGVFCLIGAFISPEERSMQTVSKQSKLIPASQINYCPECGAKVTGKFCSNCGKSMNLKV